MELFRDTHFDFMKYRRFWIVVSFLLVLGGVYAVFGPHRLNLGIDFAGGTQVTLGFRQTPDLDKIRDVLKREGMGAAEIQRFGDPKANQVIVKTAVTKGSEEGSFEKVTAALNRELNQGQTGFDLNLASSDDITKLFVQADPDKVGGPGQDPRAVTAHYEPVSSAIVAERAKDGMFKDFSRLTHLPGVSPAAAAVLQPQAHFGNFAVLAIENVGPQIGGELRRQGFLAVIMSLLGMLAYIWFRFELRFGIGAVMASIHDVMVTLLFFWAFGFEFNLITVAAFLTLIGYSMNDTVVIFDRVRENMRKSRRKPLIEVMNDSINETLSRTIMTGGLTFLTVLSLLILGGDVLRGFAFVMTVGIIVGTYSSVYVASPFALLWEKHFGSSGKLTNRSGSAPVARGEGGRPAPGRDDAAAAGEGGEQPLPRPRPRQTRRRA